MTKTAGLVERKTLPCEDWLSANELYWPLEQPQFRRESFFFSASRTCCERDLIGSYFPTPSEPEVCKGKKMAAVIGLVSSPKISGRFYYLFAAVRNGTCAPGPGKSWKRESSSFSEQESSREDMPVSMENPYKEPPKKCVLCGVTVDYKNIQLLSQFISPYTGHIHGQHITGLCTKKQKQIAKAIKRAHQMGFMSVMYKDPVFRNDPKLCNIKYPE